MERAVATGRLRSALTSPAVAISIAAATVAAAVASGALNHAAHQGGGANNHASAAIIVAFLAVGLVVALRRPGNATGWLLLGVALSFTLSGVGTGYSILDYRMRHGSLPLGGVALLLLEGWAPAIVLLSSSVLLFPDGRAATRPCRYALGAVLAAGAVWQGGAFGIAVSALVEHHVRIDAAGDLWAIDHPVGNWAWWYDVAQPVFFLSVLAAWLVWLQQQVGVYRRARGDRRLQLRWLYGGAVVCLIGGVLSMLWSNASSEPLRIVGATGTLLLVALPISIGVGVTKFHLYDVDRVMSRTLSYGLVTALVIGCYAGVVTLATKAIGLSSPVAVAASTLVAAALFNPLRRRVQRGVDRRFNRARYDAEALVAGFAQRLRETIALDSVRDELAEVVSRAVEPAKVAIWMRGSGTEPGARR